MKDTVSNNTINHILISDLFKIIRMKKLFFLALFVLIGIFFKPIGKSPNGSATN